MVEDDIARWKLERSKLQEQLEARVMEKASIPLIRYLGTRIRDLGRYISELERDGMPKGPQSSETPRR